MRSFYRFGFSARPFSLGLGDTLGPDKSKKFYDDLDRANDKYGIVTEWKEKHPDLQKDLGSDYENWKLVSQDETRYGSAAQALRDRLEKEVMVDVNPEISISADDMMAGNIWMAAVDRLYVLAANHTGKASETPPTASNPAPEANPGLLAPLVPEPASPIPIVLAVGGAALLGLLVIGALSK